MSRDYKIEKGIEVPPRYTSKYPLGEMEVGDSFLLPYDGDDPDLVMNRVAASTHYCTSLTGRRFTSRKTGKGIRCWRIE